MVEGFNAGWEFEIVEQPVGDIESLSRALSLIERHKDCLVIRGSPLPGVDRSRRQRRLKEVFSTPRDGRRWGMIDFDKIELPGGLSLAGNPRPDR